MIFKLSLVCALSVVWTLSVFFQLCVPSGPISSCNSICGGSQFAPFVLQRLAGSLCLFGTFALSVVAKSVGSFMIDVKSNFQVKSYTLTKNLQVLVVFKNLYTSMCFSSSSIYKISRAKSPDSDLFSMPSVYVVTIIISALSPRCTTYIHKSVLICLTKQLNNIQEGYLAMLNQSSIVSIPSTKCEWWIAVLQDQAYFLEEKC